MNTFDTYLSRIEEIGFVDQATASIAYVSGLPRAKINEIILFETGEFGQVLSLQNNDVEALVFSKNALKVGTRATRTAEFLQIPVGKEFLGQTIDPFGNLLDKLQAGGQKSNLFRQIDIPPSGIDTRARINKPLETGISIVDMLIPLGQGQRQLVIGDRKTGKTNFLLETILTQARLGTICIYTAIGKKKQDIKRAEEFFKQKNIMNRVVIIASGSEDPTSIIFLTPYSAMTLAEYFRDEGLNVLVVLDDLSTHAKFYREIGLLSRRFPGRNAYPADIFYTHAKLLERAGNFKTKKGDVAITCFPVVESVQGDITGYIQTNLMSMTDGHIYFDSDLFAKGRRPAINPFLSVTRVGRQTQSMLKRTISRELISFLTLRDRMENFTHFGAEAGESIKDTLATGERIFAFFDQTSEDVLDSNFQIFIFGLLWFGIWKQKDLETMRTEINKLLETYKSQEQMRQEIAMLIKKAESLNSLLMTLGESSQGFLKKANIV